MSRLLPEIEAEWKKIEDALAQKWTEAQPENAHRYTTLTRTSDDPQFRSKVVRLDRVILACHLIAARYSFTSMPKIMEFLTTKYRETIESFVGKSAAKRAIGGGTKANVIVQLLSTLDGFIRENIIQASIEARIRRISLDYRRNLAAIPFARRVHPRKTKLVYTRL